MPLKPGHVLRDQYQILGLIGRGGFGFVYHARDIHLRQDVAVKELIPTLLGDEPALKRFLAEARAAMQLSHDRIVRTHTVFPEGENGGETRYYIVMEYMAGGSLEDLLSEPTPLPVPEAVRIAAGVCQGLDYLHSRRVVHCDLKPANVLFEAGPSPSLQPGGAAKLADFGIAHVSDLLLSRSWHTPSGFVAGTLPYMSPEQADGCRDDPRLDLYALGAILYRMLTGCTYVDFEHTDNPSAQARNLNRIKKERPRPPSHHNPSVPRWLDAAVLKALDKRPEKRFQSAVAFRAALSPPVEETTRPRIKPGGTPLPSWFWAAAGVAAALLVLIAVGIYALVSRPGPTPTPEPTEAAVVGPTKAPSATRTPTPTWTIAMTPTPFRSPTPTPVSLPVLARVTDVGGLGLKLQAQPGAQSPRVATLQEGTELLVWGRTQDSTWLSVATLADGPYGVLHGWVSAQSVETDVRIDDLPVSPVATFTPTPRITLTPTPTQSAAPASAGLSLPVSARVIKIGGLGLNMRAQPSLESPRVATLQEGTGLLVWGRTQDGTWLSVTTPADSPYATLHGWVAVQWVEVDGPIDDLPVSP